MSCSLTSPWVLPLILCLFVQAAECQTADSNAVFIVDSLVVRETPAPDDTLMMADIDSMAVIKNKDSLLRLGYAGYEKLTYIFTKAYRTRPDSLRAFPTTKQMAPVNGAWLLHGTPYSGEVIDYYLSGRKREKVRMVRGVADGRMQRWYQNGRLQFEREYKEGKIDGMDREYYEDGSLWKEGRFEADSAEGMWKAYFPNGQIKLFNIYRHGVLIDSAIRYYSNGLIRERMRIENGKIIVDRRMKKFDQLLEKTGQRERNGDFSAAIRLATKIIQLDSADADAWFVRGTLRLNESRFDEAIADLDKAIAIEPYFDIALANRAFARIQKYEHGRGRPQEKEKICSDLRMAAFLGDKEEPVLDALKKYRQY